MWEKYLAFKPTNDKNQYMSYEEFKKLHDEKKIVHSGKSKEELIREAEEIRKKDMIS